MLIRQAYRSRDTELAKPKVGTATNFEKIMNKADLVDAVHTKLQGTKKAAEEAVDTVFDGITGSLAKGQEVSISGFGTFIVRKRAARQGVNPRTGEKIQIKATTTPKFRAGKNLKEAVR